MRVIGALLAGVSVLSFLYVPSANAQDGAESSVEAPDPAANEGPQAEIVVTANRREQSLQDVPIAVQAVTGDDLEQRAIVSTTDIQYAAPSVTYTTGSTPASSGFSIRGIGTATFSPSTEQSVGLMIDGVPVGATGAGFGAFTDVNRVEVLRGPQGMLFGKNASAGLISIISNAPDTDAFGLRAKISYGSFDEFNADGMINLPVSDDVAVRFAGRFRSYDGYIYNRTTNEFANGDKEYFMRGRLRAQITPSLRADVYGEISRIDATCCNTTPWVLDTTRPANNAILAAGVVPGRKNRDIAVNFISATDQLNHNAALELNLDLGGVTLTSMTAWRDFHSRFDTDADMSPVAVLFGYLDDSANQFTQELRLSSNGPGTIEYVAGLFYYSADIERNFVTFNFLNRRTQSFVESESLAAFGEATVNLTDRFSLVAGGRITRDTIDDRELSGLPTGPVSPVVSGRADATDFSYRFTAK